MEHSLQLEGASEPSGIVNQKEYAYFNGRLLHLVMNTRPDIAFAVARLAQYTIKPNSYPFDGLTPLRGEWDEYFLLRVLLNRRETKMSPQTYRWFVCSLRVDWWKCYCDRSRVAHHHHHARIITSNYHALSTYLRNPLVHTIECVFSIRSTDQWIDLPPSQLPPPIATSSPTYQS
jgi:hypothetical protein